MRLRVLRNLCGWTRPELARRADLSPLTITSYEIGKVQPSAAALGRLADALGCSIDALYGRELSDRIRESVAASRAAQGLPPTITDPATLERVAAILRLVSPDWQNTPEKDDQAMTG